MKNPKALFVIISLSILSVLGLAAVMPLLPTIAKQFQVSVESIWVIAGAFSIPGVFAAPLGGILADKIGRKTVLVLALIILTLSSLACLWVTTFDGLIVCRIFQGIGTGTMATMSSILIGDFFEANERASVMGLSMTCVTVTSALAPMIGGFLGDVTWRVPFALSLFSIPVLFVVLSMKFTLPEKSVSSKSYFTESFKIIMQPYVLALLCFTFFLFVITYGPSLTYFPIFIDYYFHSSTSVIGIIFFIGAMVTCITALQVGKVLKKFSLRTVLIGCTLLVLLSNLVFFYLPSSVWWLTSSMIFIGIAQGLLAPILASKIISVTTQQTRGAVMAVHSTMSRTSQAVAPFLASLCWTFIGPVGPYVLGAVLSVLLFCFIGLIAKHDEIQVH